MEGHSFSTVCFSSQLFRLLGSILFRGALSVLPSSDRENQQCDADGEGQRRRLEAREERIWRFIKIGGSRM